MAALAKDVKVVKTSKKSQMGKKKERNSKFQSALLSFTILLSEPSSRSIEEAFGG